MSTENQNSEDPNILGKLSDEEQQALMALRQQSGDVLTKIGQLEVQKQRLLTRLDSMDEDAQKVMNQISERLGLKEGQQWVALADGSVRLVPQPGESPAAPAEG